MFHYVWPQVDLLKPTLLHGVNTQGVSVKLRDNYITFFTVSYSLDQENWTTYRGKTTSTSKVCSKLFCLHVCCPLSTFYIRFNICQQIIMIVFAGFGI